MLSRVCPQNLAFITINTQPNHVNLKHAGDSMYKHYTYDLLGKLIQYAICVDQ